VIDTTTGKVVYKVSLDCEVADYSFSTGYGLYVRGVNNRIDIFDADNGKRLDGTKAELEKFQGSWKVISCRISIKKVRSRELAAMSFEGEKVLGLYKDTHAVIFKGDRWIDVQFYPKSSKILLQRDYFVITLDSSHKPAHINLTRVGEGGGLRSLQRGIYKRDGSRLWICVTSGERRPTEFSDELVPGASVTLLFILEQS
jgi:uncharacterized protein (TIGR03067 family)